MLAWDKNVIEYLDRAEEYSKFSLNVISSIKPYFHKCRNALEIGCGIGNVSIGFSVIFDYVVCIDVSCDIINNLKRKIKSKDINNIDARVLSSSELITGKYDLIFTSFFFEQDDFIKIIKRNLSKDGVAIYIFRKNMKHIIRNDKSECLDNSYEIFEKRLMKEGLPYERIAFTFCKNQPFIDDEDIKKFCRLYDTDYDTYKRKVKLINDKNYKYLYEVNRDTYIYIINNI